MPTPKTIRSLERPAFTTLTNDWIGLTQPFVTTKWYGQDWPFSAAHYLSAWSARNLAQTSKFFSSGRSQTSGCVPVSSQYW